MFLIWRWDECLWKEEVCGSSKPLLVTESIKNVFEQQHYYCFLITAEDHFKPLTVKRSFISNRFLDFYVRKTKLYRKKLKTRTGTNETTAVWGVSFTSGTRGQSTGTRPEATRPGTWTGTECVGGWVWGAGNGWGSCSNIWGWEVLGTTTAFGDQGFLLLLLLEDPWVLRPPNWAEYPNTVCIPHSPNPAFHLPQTCSPTIQTPESHLGAGLVI